MFSFFKRIWLLSAVLGLLFFFQSVSATASTFLTRQTVANATGIIEVKASRSLLVNALPASGESITIGSCVITFITQSGSTLDDFDCSDNAASIDRDTGTGNNLRTTSTIGGRIRAISNITDLTHGALLSSGTSTSVIFVSSGTEISDTAIAFVDTTQGDIVSSLSVVGVVGESARKQVVVFTPNVVTDGELYRISLNTKQYEYISSVGETTADIVRALQTGLLVDTYVDCVEDGTKITCTAKTAGIPFTYDTQCVDVSVPNLILLGSGTEYVAYNGVYNEPGATWTDNVDGTGNLSGAVVGSVDTTKLGYYVLEYRYTDLAENQSMAIKRVVFVVDRTPPVVTLSGGNMELDQFTTFVDPGANWMDNVDGSGMSYIVSGEVNTGVAGLYNLEYWYADAAENTGNSVYRTVRVIDRENPVLMLSGTNMTIEFGSDFVDPGAYWTDNGDGSGFILATTGEVDTGIVGRHTLEYWYADTAGNTSNAVKRMVFVVDTTAPTVRLIGLDLKELEVKSNYRDEGAEWTDIVDGTGTVYAMSGMVDTGTVGSYILEYRYVDRSGNTGDTVTRTVNVVDTIKPVVTLIGSGTITITQGSVYTESGAIWTDNVDGSGDVAVSGTVDTNITGTYILTYSYTDKAGNIGNVVARTVMVIDLSPEAVTGSCGTIYGTCMTGTVVSGTDNTCGSDDMRTCNGLNGGGNVVCNVTNVACVAPPEVVTGSCGVSYGICLTGSVVFGKDNVCGPDDTRNCNGLNGGGNASCSTTNVACVIPNTGTINTPSSSSSSNGGGGYGTLIPMITTVLSNTGILSQSSGSSAPVCNSKDYVMKRFGLLKKLDKIILEAPVSKKKYVNKMVLNLIKKIETMVLSSANPGTMVETIVCRILSLKEIAKVNNNNILLYLSQYIEDKLVLMYQ